VILMGPDTDMEEAVDIGKRGTTFQPAQPIAPVGEWLLIEAAKDFRAP